MMVLMEQGRKK